MTTTMQLIAKQTVGSGGAASVTFSNIPQTYTDLKVVVSARTTRAAVNDTMTLQLNSTNITGRRIYGDGSSAASDTTPQILPPGANATANTFGSTEFYIPNYTSTSQYKSVSIDDTMENNATGSYIDMIAGIYSANTAVTSITLDPDTGNWVEYSTFYLYGISNSTTTQATTVPYASGGDIIRTDGSYWYHTFLYSGTFTPLKELTCDYLVVAGGGGGGGDAGAPGGGGGGGGGYRTSIGGTALTLTANTAYAATVGAGGAAGAPSAASYTGVQGGNSVFSTITSAGGGGGAGSINTDTITSGSGGSGGGGARPGSGNTTMAGGSGNTPSTSPSQGNNGGRGWHNAGTSSNGGGGGGASAAGQNADTVGRGGDGGAGSANSISGTSVTYAGGGGGGSDTGTNGAGGAGGGGAGGATGVAGTANRGGGGGGAANYNAAGGNGGSGIIVLRYAV